MKCPFKKITTQRTSKSENGGTIVTIIEEFKECELSDCMAAILSEPLTGTYKCELVKERK